MFIDGRNSPIKTNYMKRRFGVNRYLIQCPNPRHTFPNPGQGGRKSDLVLPRLAVYDHAVGYMVQALWITRFAPR